MKLNSLALLASLESTQDNYKFGVNCFTKLDCKIFNHKSSPDVLKKFQVCKKDSTQTEAKCELSAAGLNNDQTEMALNIVKHTQPCALNAERDIVDCILSCHGKDKEQCLWKCIRSLKIKIQKCSAEVAKVPNHDAAKSIDCMENCDKPSYSDIFDCQYQCSKDVYDALLAKDGNNANLGNKPNNSTESSNSTEPSNPSEPETKTSNSAQSNKPGQSNALFSIENKTLTSIALPVLMFLLLL